MALDLESRPNRVPWPPSLGAAALALAALAERAHPVGLGLGPAMRWLGWALIAAGLGLDFRGIATLRRALQHPAAPRRWTPPRRRTLRLHPQSDPPRRRRRASASAGRRGDGPTRSIPSAGFLAWIDHHNINNLRTVLITRASVSKHCETLRIETRRDKTLSLEIFRDLRF
jgi:hypothetical protein